MAFDLYVITDETLSRGRSHAEIARQAVDGGAGVIQLRDKTRGSRELVKIGRDIRKITRDAGALFIVNDRLDVALACGADGVHLGQGDLSPGTARQLAPPGFLIGVSVGDAVQARKAEAAGADYVVLSPVFTTASKTDAGPGHGLAELAKIRSAVRVPVLAIGGITRANASEVIRAGADGIAVISAVVSAPGIRQAASALLQAVTDAKREAGR